MHCVHITMTRKPHNSKYEVKYLDRQIWPWDWREGKICNATGNYSLHSEPMNVQPMLWTTATLKKFSNAFKSVGNVPSWFTDFSLFSVVWVRLNVLTINILHPLEVAVASFY